tara:strand:+ start:35323 stop:35781 length:459 start_codon:yes stop_codon:yes gene_type:complete
MNPEPLNSTQEKITAISSRTTKPRRRGSWRIAKDLPTSFYYAFQGISYGFLSQRNFRFQVFVGAIVLLMGMLLELNAIKMAMIILTISLVLILELINTAIEATVDLAIGRRFHPLAKIAKDCSAAAVLIASLGSVLLALILLGPPLLALLAL